jgi:hypothetical protein
VSETYFPRHSVLTDDNDEALARALADADLMRRKLEEALGEVRRLRHELALATTEPPGLEGTKP